MASASSYANYVTEIKLGTIGVPENWVSLQVDTDGWHIHVQGFHRLFLDRKKKRL